MARILSCLVVLVVGCSGGGGPDDIPPPPPGPDSDFVRAQGGQLVVGTDAVPYRIHGINFSNNFWIDTTDGLLTTPHNTAADYGRVADMGFNAIRFSLSYLMFERQSEPGNHLNEGWAWLDERIGFARDNGLGMILDMHVPHGGFQASDGSIGQEVWTNATTRGYLKTLWRAIAERYADDRTVIAYGLLNEPAAPTSVTDWQEFANELIAEIRQVDPNHLIMVESVLNVIGDPDYEPEPQTSIVRVDDDNVLYDVRHFYSPFEYTHQFFPNEFGEPISEGGNYPDASKLQMPPDLDWVSNIAAEGNAVPADDSGWQLYESPLFRVDNPDIIVGTPSFASFDNSGTVLFDDFEILEYDGTGALMGTIVSHDVGSMDGWYPFSENGSADFDLEIEGRDDGAALSIASHSGPAAWSTDALAFVPEQGRQYRIRGYMRGVSVSAGAEVFMTIDFHRSVSGTPVMRFDRDFLDFELGRWLAFGTDNDVPVMVAEFGIFGQVFDTPEKGGVRWITDVLEILLERDTNFAFWAYRGDFGVYLMDSEQAFDVASRQDGTYQAFADRL